MEFSHVAPATGLSGVAQPTTFSASLPSRATSQLVVACTFDPLGLFAPLQIWLQRLTGLSIAPQWVGYGVVSEALSEPGSAWNVNRDGMNVLILREADLKRGSADLSSEHLLDVLDKSCARRRGPTIVLLPPTPESSAALDSSREDEGLAARLGSIAGVRVHGEAALHCQLRGLHYHSSFLDRVAHAPYSPAACSVFASVIVRELACHLAPRRKASALKGTATYQWKEHCSSL